MDYHSMKRTELQALCREHNIPANTANSVMADKLSELLKEKQKPRAKQRTCMKSSVDTADESEPAVVRRQEKKVRFSPDVQSLGSEQRSGKKRKAMVTDTKVRSKTEAIKADNDDSVELIDDSVQVPVRLTRSRVQVLGNDDVVPSNEKKQGRRVVKKIKTGINAVEGTKGSLGGVTKSKEHTLGKGGVIQREKNKQSKGEGNYVEKASESVEEKLVGRARVTRSKVQTLIEDGMGPDLNPRVNKRSGTQVTNDAETVDPPRESTANPVRVTRARRQTLTDDCGNKVTDPQPEKKTTRRDTRGPDVSNKSSNTETLDPPKESTENPVRVTRARGQTLTDDCGNKVSDPQPEKKTTRRDTRGPDVSNKSSNTETLDHPKESTENPVRVTRARGQTLTDDCGNKVSDPQPEKKTTRRDTRGPDVSNKSSNVAPGDEQDLLKRKVLRNREVEVADEGVKLGHGMRQKRSEETTAEGSGSNDRADKGLRQSRRNTSKPEVSTVLNQNVSKVRSVNDKKSTRSRAPMTVKASGGKDKSEVGKEVEESLEDAGRRNVGRRKSVIQPEKIEVVLQDEEPVKRQSRKVARRKSVMPKTKVKEIVKPLDGKREIKKDMVDEGVDIIKENDTGPGKAASENEMKTVASATGTHRSRKRRGDPIIEDQIIETIHVSSVEESPRPTRSGGNSEVKSVTHPHQNSVGKKQVSISKTSATRMGITSKKRVKLSGTKQSDLEGHAVKSNSKGSPVLELGKFAIDEELIETEHTSMVDKSVRRSTRTGIGSERNEVGSTLGNVDRKKPSQSVIKDQHIGDALSSRKVTHFKHVPVPDTAPGRITRSGIKGKGTAGTGRSEVSKGARGQIQEHMSEVSALNAERLPISGKQQTPVNLPSFEDETLSGTLLSDIKTMPISPTKLSECVVDAPSDGSHFQTQDGSQEVHVKSAMFGEAEVQEALDSEKSVLKSARPEIHEKAMESTEVGFSSMRLQDEDTMAEEPDLTVGKDDVMESTKENDDAAYSAVSSAVCHALLEQSDVKTLSKEMEPPLELPTLEGVKQLFADDGAEQDALTSNDSLQNNLVGEHEVADSGEHDEKKTSSVADEIDAHAMDSTVRRDDLETDKYGALEQSESVIDAPSDGSHFQTQDQSQEVDVKSAIFGEAEVQEAVDSEKSVLKSAGREIHEKEMESTEPGSLSMRLQDEDTMAEEPVLTVGKNDVMETTKENDDAAYSAVSSAVCHASLEQSDVKRISEELEPPLELPTLKGVEQLFADDGAEQDAFTLNDSLPNNPVGEHEVADNGEHDEEKTTSVADEIDAHEMDSTVGIYDLEPNKYDDLEQSESVIDAPSDRSHFQTQDQSQEVDVKSAIFGEAEVQEAVDSEISVLKSARREIHEKEMESAEPGSLSMRLQDEDTMAEDPVLTVGKNDVMETTKENDDAAYSAVSSAVCHAPLEQSDVKRISKELEPPLELPTLEGVKQLFADDGAEQDALNSNYSLQNNLVDEHELADNGEQDEENTASVADEIDAHEMDSTVGMYDLEPNKYDDLEQSGGDDTLQGLSMDDEEIKDDVVPAQGRCDVADGIDAHGTDLGEYDMEPNEDNALEQSADDEVLQDAHGRDLAEYDMEPNQEDALEQSVDGDILQGLATDEKEIEDDTVTTWDKRDDVDHLNVHEMDCVVGDYDAEPRRDDAVEPLADDDKLQGIVFDDNEIEDDLVTALGRSDVADNVVDDGKEFAKEVEIEGNTDREDVNVDHPKEGETCSMPLTATNMLDGSVISGGDHEDESATVNKEHESTSMLSTDNSRFDVSFFGKVDGFNMDQQVESDILETPFSGNDVDGKDDVDGESNDTRTEPEPILEASKVTNTLEVHVAGSDVAIERLGDEIDVKEGESEQEPELPTRTDSPVVDGQAILDDAQEPSQGEDMDVMPEDLVASHGQGAGPMLKEGESEQEPELPTSDDSPVVDGQAIVDDAPEPSQGEDMAVMPEEPMLNLAVDAFTSIEQSDPLTSKEARQTPAASGNDTESKIDINNDDVTYEDRDSDLFGNAIGVMDTENDSGNEQHIMASYYEAAVGNENIIEQGGPTTENVNEQLSAPVDHDLDGGEVVEDRSNHGVDEPEPVLEPLKDINTLAVPVSGPGVAVDELFSDQIEAADIGGHESRITEHSPITSPVDDIVSDPPTLVQDGDRNEQEKSPKTSGYVDWGDYGLTTDEFQKSVSANESGDVLGKSKEDEEGADYQTSARTISSMQESSNLAVDFITNLEKDSRYATDGKSNKDVDMLKEKANTYMSPELSWPDSSLKALLTTASTSRKGHIINSSETAVSFGFHDDSCGGEGDVNRTGTTTHDFKYQWEMSVSNDGSQEYTTQSTSFSKEVKHETFGVADFDDKEEDGSGKKQHSEFNDNLLREAAEFGIKAAQPETGDDSAASKGDGEF